MTLGERIKTLRTEKNITQEKLAEELNVSRSAIAKWESDGGVPEIGNLNMIAKLFNVSLDYVVNGEENSNEKDSAKGNENKWEAAKPEKTETSICKSDYVGKWCDINLKGWNDGVFNSFIVAEDKDFFFYRRLEEDRNILGKSGNKVFVGAIGKKYITNLEVISGKKEDKLKDKMFKCEPNQMDCVEEIDKAYFAGKKVNIDIAMKEGIISGFFDFRSDDYMNVVIAGIDEAKVNLAFGDALDIAVVTKIEEIIQGMV